MGKHRREIRLELREEGGERLKMRPERWQCSARTVDFIPGAAGSKGGFLQRNGLDEASRGAQPT